MRDDDDTPPAPAPAAEGDGAYEVGYGKPPRHSRFKPGNKFGKGRPRGARNIASLVREACQATVAAKIGGTVRKLPKIVLALHQLANKASAGDLKAIAKLIELHERYGPREEEGQGSDEQAAYDLATLVHHLKMRGETD